MKKQAIDLNVKQFMQSAKYEELRDQLSRELNHNSVFVNTFIRAGSNLIERHDIEFYKSKLEKQLLKDIKHNYKKNLNSPMQITEKNEFLTAFAACGIPNWNVKFKVIDNYEKVLN